MSRRPAVRVTSHGTAPEDAVPDPDQYRAGYEAGYALGLRLGREDSGKAFDGTSIIVPVHEPDAVIRTIQRLEATTPHPYELLVADAGAPETFKRYMLKRSGSIRHIKGKNGENLAQVVNRAITVSLGEWIAIVAEDPPYRTNWLGALLQELERYPEAEVACAVSNSPGSLPSAGEGAVSAAEAAAPLGSRRFHGMLFRRQLRAKLGLWDEGTATAEDYIRKWVERVQEPQRILLPPGCY